MTIEQSPNEAPLSIRLDGRHTIEKSYNVQASSKAHALTLLAAESLQLGIPFVDSLGNQLSQFIRCTEITIEPIGRDFENVESFGWFQATLHFENLLQATNGKEIVPGATAAWSSERSLTWAEADHDRNGSKIVNSAGVPFSPGVRAPKAGETLVAEWVRIGTILDAIAQTRIFSGKCNSLEWAGANPREVLCHGITPTEVPTGGLIKYTGRFEYRPSRSVRTATGVKLVPGFTNTPANKGLLEKNPDFSAPEGPGNRPLRRIKVGNEDGDDVFTSDPLPLTTAGAYAGDDGELYALEVEVIDEVDFNTLGII